MPLMFLFNHYGQVERFFFAVPPTNSWWVAFTFTCKLNCSKPQPTSQLGPDGPSHVDEKTPCLSNINLVCKSKVFKVLVC